MLLRHQGTPRDRDARAQLAAALPDAEIGELDEIGVFEITLEAEDQDDALTRVWDAVAAAGVDDHIVFLEHLELPEHWRHLSRPASPVRCRGLWCFLEHEPIVVEELSLEADLVRADA